MLWIAVRILATLGDLLAALGASLGLAGHVTNAANARRIKAMKRARAKL
jgi:hypothetical protein